MKALFAGAAAAMFAAIAAPVHCAPEDPAKQTELKGVVLTPDGKPAAGATVIYGMTNIAPGISSIVQKTQTDTSGAFVFPPLPNAMGRPYGALYISSANGVAVVPVSDAASVKLHAKTSVRVRAVDEKGLPVAHASLSPQYFLLEVQQSHTYSPWDKSIASLWNVETDAQGYATLTGLPQGYITLLQVDDPQFAQPDWKNSINLAAAAKTKDQILHLEHGGSVSGAVFYESTHQPAAGIAVDAMEVGDAGSAGTGVTDKDGRYSIKRLHPGAYDLEVEYRPSLPAQTVDWTATAHAGVAIAAKKQIAGMNFMLIHGAVITGRIMDPVTGKPVESVNVRVTGPAHPASSRGSGYTSTNAEGVYSLRVPAGAQRVSIFSHGASDYVPPQSITVADGETKTLDWKIKPPKAQRVIHGTVVGQDGAPLAGTEVYLLDAYSGYPQKITDAQGNFAFDPNVFGDDARLFARSGKLGTLTAAAPPSDDAAVTLKLAPNAFCVFQGDVKDGSGKPLTGVKVALIRWTKQNGGSDIDTVTTDANGRYAFAPTYSDVEYSVRADMKGYASKYSEQTPATAGKTLDVPVLRLMKADSFAGGVVLDPKGKPVAGAKVRAYDIPGLEVSTDKNGRFRLTGVPRDKTVVGVEAPEDRQASIQITSGSSDNTIRVKSRAEQEEEGKRFVALRDADTKNHGDGGDAHALLKAAQDNAAKDGKSVLLVFHASWCGPCFMLHRYLEDPKVKQVLDKHFVVQDLDIWEEGDKKKEWENPGGTDIYKQYGGPNSVPFYVVMDGGGKKLGDSLHNGENMGMPTQTGDVQFFLDTLKMAQPKLTNTEVALLKDELKRHASL
ncbi:MAG: hypothetical protein JWQ02_434 [Capsulimonas sp.]|nr:hypothetical protein [Capsulimonas sp.]